jgi:hypothetical protein
MAQSLCLPIYPAIRIIDVSREDLEDGKRDVHSPRTAKQQEILDMKNNVGVGRVQER